MSTSQERIPLTIQFTPGKDDDLIGFIASLPHGKRNGRIKAMLRAGMEKERQGDQLAQLTTAIETLSKQIASGVTVNGHAPVDPVQRMSTEQKERRASKMDKAAW